MYISAFAAPDTIDTMPEKTLLAFADHGQLHGVMATDGGDADDVLAQIRKAGIDIDALALKLQIDGAGAFVKSWKQLLQRIADKASALEDKSKGPALP
jgi:transaldolase